MLIFLFLIAIQYTAFKNEKYDDLLPVKEPPHTTIISAVPYDKPIPGSTLRCLEDPNEMNAVPATIVATDDLNEARDRFDRFWDSKRDPADKY